MYSTRSIYAGCGTCKLCRPTQQYQTLMPHNFVKIVETNIDQSSKSYFVLHNGLIFGDLASIPFDSYVDPGPYACFNCWRVGHSHYDCNLEELQLFCQNCGRKGVMMSECPRCALAYLEFGVQKMERRCCGYGDDREYKQLWPPRMPRARAIRGVHGEPSINAITSTQHPAKELSLKSCKPGPFNLYFKALRDIVVQNIHDTKTSNAAAEKFVEVTDQTTTINCTKSTISSGIGDECLTDEEEEDYNLVVVDENEKSKPRQPPSEGVREFLNLMDAVRHLAIDIQSSVALQFVRKRRVLMNEKKGKSLR